MTTIVWPSSLSVVAALDLSIEYDVQLNIARGGAIDTYGLPGARWVATLTFAADKETRYRPQIEALVASLRGGARALSMHHLGRPTPNGTLTGSPTVATATAKGDNTLSIANAFGTNLFAYTQEFDNAAWGKQWATVTADAAIAPDGTLTADKLIATAATNVHQIYQTVSVVAGEKYAISVSAQAAELSAIELQVVSGTGGFGIPPPNARFNLATGTTAGVVKGSASIEDLGAGWRRCRFAVDAATATGTVVPLIQLYNGSESFLGDGTSGVHIWGAQWERGSTASAYSAYATIKAGDLLGVGTELFMADEDATAAAGATMTVKVSPAVRNVYTVGTAVVWDKPSILWIPRSNIAGPFPYAPGKVRPGFALELVERG